MKKSFKAKTSKSMFRSKIKKRYKNNLPTKKVFDPFLQMWMYYNKNGRVVVYRNYRWEAL